MMNTPQLKVRSPLGRALEAARTTVRPGTSSPVPAHARATLPTPQPVEVATETPVATRAADAQATSRHRGAEQPGGVRSRVRAQRSTRAAEHAWMDYAACRGLEPHHFFAEGGTVDADLSYEIAMDACDRCSVVASCRIFALEHMDLDGIWGGTTSAERRAIWRRHRRATRRHGTETA